MDANERRLKTQLHKSTVSSLPQNRTCARVCKQMCVCIRPRNNAPRRCLHSERLPGLTEPGEGWLLLSKMADIISLGVTATAK